MHQEGLDPNTNFLASLLLFWSGRPKPREWIAAAALTAVLAACFGLRGSFLESALQLVSYAGAGAIVAAALRFVTDRWDWKLLAKVLFPPCFGLFAALLLSLCTSLVTYDNLLYNFDGSLGFQPSFLAGQIVLSVPGLAGLTRLMYDILPILLTMAYIVEERREARAARDLIFFFLLLGVFGAGGFLLFPAVGSCYLFRGFPFHPPFLSSIPIVPSIVTVAAPRNCMPSLHTSWALAILWTARRFSLPWRLFFWAALAFMLLQAQVYHYLIDMIVALPFTLAIYALTRTAVPWSERPRLQALVFGAFATAAWMIALRFETAVFQHSPALPWLAVLATAGLVLYLRALLERAVDARARIAVNAAATA